MAGIVIRSLTTHIEIEDLFRRPPVLADEIEDPSIGAPRRLALRELRGSHAETRPDATNPGDSSGEAIPVPIPNTEVKLSSAEDTERAAFRENRSSPGFLL